MITITEEIKKLSSYIEENTRASETSGITYIDPRNFKERILLKQNHVIFGRRGAGKSSLIKTIKENSNRNYYYSYTNIEDLKDVSFPNILIHVLGNFYEQISSQIKGEIKIWQIRKHIKANKLCKELQSSLNEFKKQIPNPDTFDEEIKSKQSSSQKADVGVASDLLIANSSESEINEIEVAKKVNRNKLESIKNSIPQLKKSIKKIQGYSPAKHILIIFDDFYFLKKSSQMFFVDFFHRLTKDTNLFIKIATIRHRSKLYSPMDGSYVGTELGHDIHEIDLDYNLDRFEELKSFMRSLIGECSSLSKAKVNIDDLFSGGGFTQLCLASGGVPRDFLTLFVKVSNNYDSVVSRKISKTNITESAIQNMSSKYSYLKTDSAEDKEILEIYLDFIKEQIIRGKKTNMFLISNSDIDQYPQVKQAIKELVDLRMLHLVDPNTSASGGTGGQRFTAYMVDIGLYPTAMQQGFTQLDPGVTDDAGRKDEMRGAPKITLHEYNQFVEGKNLKHKLKITED
ncbi:MAG: hypothetical protein HYU69_15265 [Bacteroidetes bacterium]|nr:hypothetical protein [Bacteroidota bacterium]